MAMERVVMKKQVTACALGRSPGRLCDLDGRALQNPGFSAAAASSSELVEVRGRDCETTMSSPNATSYSAFRVAIFFSA